MQLALIFLLAGLAMFGQGKGAPAADLPAGLPKGAVAVDSTTWKWTDPQGKVWHYRATPFGVTKQEAPKETKKEEKETVDDPALLLMKVKDEGAILRFSKPGPFGTYVWTKKKTELTKDEEWVWERAKAKATAAAKKE